MKPSVRITGFRPSVRSSGRTVATLAWTYNQNDITYNQADLPYNGSYSYDTFDAHVRITEPKVNVRIQ